MAGSESDISIFGTPNLAIIFCSNAAKISSFVFVRAGIPTKYKELRQTKT